MEVVVTADPEEGIRKNRHSDRKVIPEEDGYQHSAL